MDLVGVRKAAHTRHDTENVVVGGIHIDGGRLVSAHGVVGQREVEGGIVNTGEVAGAAGLVILGVQGEGVHVDTNRRDVGVVLERLHQVEVRPLTLRESIVAVELHLGNHRGVLTRKTLDAGDGVAGLLGGTVEPVSEVEVLLTLVLVQGVTAGRERITLGHPDELLARVVEGQLDLVGGGGNRLRASELELLDQVLVGDLGEAAALLRVEVDVVDVERGRDQTSGIRAVNDASDVRPAQVLELLELDVDLDLVVLEGDQGESQTGVAVEPELERNVQGVLGGAAAVLVRGVGLTAQAVTVASTVGLLGEGVHQLGHVANHLGITGLLPGGAGQLVPDVQPLAIVLVDLLSTDLDLDVVHELVTHPVEPTELATRAICSDKRYRGKSGLKVNTVDQITITADRAGNTLTKVGHTVEGLLDGLHREVRVTTVQLLEQRNLRV